MSAFRIAFVGNVEAAPRWLPMAIRQRAVLEAVCGPDAESALRRHQARWAFDSVADLLRESPPDAVFIHLPLRERPAVIKQCLAAGVNVLLGGAPGPSSACRRIDSLARVSGRVVVAAPPSRYMPSMALARRLMESGRSAPPVSMMLESTLRGAPREDSDDLGPVPIDQVFEAMDAVHHLVGPVRQVFAAGQEQGALAVTVMTSTGIPVSMLLHASGPADAVGLHIELRAADGGRMIVDRQGRLLHGVSGRPEAAHAVSLSAADPAVELGYAGLLSEFIGRLREGSLRRGGLLTPADSVAAAAEAVLASAARSRPVTFRSTGERRRLAPQRVP